MPSFEAARPRTSDLLELFAANHPGPRVSLGEVADALGERGFGVLILILAAPGAVPGPAIPGFTAVFAVPLSFLAVQLAAGRAEPRLPQWLLRRSIARASFRKLVGHAAPRIRRAEKWLHPRRRLPHPLALGLSLLVLILAMALPIPFANVPPAAVICLVALGMIEKDGGAVRIGLLLAGPAVAWVVALTLGGARLVAALTG